MAGSTPLLKVRKFQIRAHLPSVIPSFVALWAILSVVGGLIFLLSPLTAILGGLAATVIHHLCELIHQAGHAILARRVGYPMIGVTYWTALGKSVYPKDEPELPARVHVRRAVGGPILSLMVGLVALLAVFLLPERGVWTLLLWFFALDMLIVFTLGALLPLGFTDGSTLLKWVPRLKEDDQERVAE
jgi:hypothetical protein